MIALKQSFALCPDPSVLAGCVYITPLYGTSSNLFGYWRLIKKGLTYKFWKAILSLSLPHEVVGICTPFCPGQNRPVFLLVFLCPQKIINKGSIPIKTSMVGCVRRLSSRSFLDDSADLMQPASNDFALIKGGLKSNPGETAMRNYAQAPTKPNKLTAYVSLKSVFTLLDNNKHIIAKDLTFTQAKPLSEYIPNSSIKFQAMVQAEGSL